MSNLKKFILLFTFLFSSLVVLGQGFSYTFTDPCTFKQRQIYIDNPAGNVFLTYNGVSQSFTQSQLLSGALEQWVNTINSQNPNGPCSGTGLVLNTSMNVLITQNNISVLTNVMSSLNDAQSMMGSSVQGIVEAKEKSSSDNSNKKNKGQTNVGGNGTTNNNPNNQTNGSTTNNNGTNPQTNGGTQTGQQPQTNSGSGNGTSGNGQTTGETNGNNGNSGNPTQGGSGQTEPPVTSPSTSPSTPPSTSPSTSPSSSGNGGNNQSGTNSEQNNNQEGGGDIKGATTTKEKVANAKQGGVVLNGDVVVINSATKSEPQQLKINMSMVKSNTDNTLVKGALLNYTTSINNSSLTFFVGKKYKSFTGIMANSSMLNFQKDYFNTTSLMTSYKYKSVTSTLGVNFTTGNLGRSNFKSFSSLGGFVGNFKVTKKINNTTMLVLVYSPYVYYYEGLWYKSGWLIVPFTAFDYRITQKFKLNLSFSGVQQFKDATINYQVLLGAKVLL